MLSRTHVIPELLCSLGLAVIDFDAESAGKQRN